MKKFISYNILLLISYTSGFSQTSYFEGYMEDLHLKFTQVDEKKFEKATKLFEDANLLFNEANQFFETLDELEKKEGISSGYNKALKKLILSSEKYKEAHLTFYNIYQVKIDEFKETMKKDSHFATGMEKAKFYERQARNNLNRANSIREIVTQADKYEWAGVKMKDAFDLEKKALIDKGRSLQIYQDYPVEYNYGWDNDYTADEIAAAFANPVLNEPPPDLLTRVRDTVPEPDTIPSEKIIFKVQIAAHTIPLTDEYLKTIYRGNIPVQTILEENWYKYQIGIFEDFKEAQKVLEECGVKKAFIAPYQGGKKISLKEALAIIEQVSK